MADYKGQFDAGKDRAYNPRAVQLLRIEILTRKFGKIGQVLSIFANGRDTTPVTKTDHVTAVKSVGNSATTPRDLTCDEDVWLMLLLLAESVASRMRELSARCTVVEVYVRDAELQSFCRQRKLGSPTCASLEIAQTAMELFRANYRWYQPIRSVGVRGAGLVPMDSCIQLSLFLDETRRSKRERIDRTVDTLRKRYGYPCLRRAVLHSDERLGAINPKDDHTVHPVGYFSNGGYGL